MDESVGSPTPLSGLEQIAERLLEQITDAETG